MNGRKNKLPPKKDPELISNNAKKDTTTTIPKKKRSFGILYTATLTVGLVALILLTVGFGKEESKKDKSLFDRFSASIISKSFMDLSNEHNSDEKKPDQFIDSVLDILNGILIPSPDTDDSDTTLLPNDDQPKPSGSIYDFDPSKVPKGETAIIPMDLSLSENGSEYIYNSTSHKPDTNALLKSKLEFFSDPASNSPLVLIVHTHGTESYSEDGDISYLDDGSELARSEDISKNVVAIGNVIAEILNKNGISTLHCTVMHDKLQYKDSYLRAEETIKEYLAKYPSIMMVIDVHRDSVLKSTGELVRPVTEVDDKASAQVMCIVGASEECKEWKNNLALALQLRERLNTKYNGLCRPPYLRSSTYNQDLTPYSILLEMGASGNSLQEAQRSAIIVAKELADMLNLL